MGRETCYALEEGVDAAGEEAAGPEEGLALFVASGLRTILRDSVWVSFEGCLGERV